MCSRDKEFTIRGIEQCLARGYDRLGFFEVDTQDQRQWTVQLTDEGQRPQAQPPMASPGQPPTPQRRPDAVPAATPARPTPLPNARGPLRLGHRPGGRAGLHGAAVMRPPSALQDPPPCATRQSIPGWLAGS